MRLETPVWVLEIYLCTNREVNQREDDLAVKIIFLQDRVKELKEENSCLVAEKKERGEPITITAFRDVKRTMLLLKECLEESWGRRKTLL